MNIILLIPSLEKSFNSNYISYKHITKKFDSKIMAFTANDCFIKAKTFVKNIEKDGSLEIFRYKNFNDMTLNPLLVNVFYKKIKENILNFNPDVIFCSNPYNLSLAIKIKKEFNIPIIILTEFAYSNENYLLSLNNKILRKIKYFKSKLVGNLVSLMHWIWLSGNVDYIITSSPDDMDRIPFFMN